MVTSDQFREMAFALPEVNEEPHFEKISYRVNKKIFATYDVQLKRASIKLSDVDQSVYCSAAHNIIYPVDNKWGKQGWTYVDMVRVHAELLKDALITAYCAVAPRKLTALVRHRID
jgi:hypothetical protein